MKGNVFSQWLKEFCALVFTQTVQAFILAIVLVLVMMSIISANESGYDAVTKNQAAGVLAIIALTSISKMESLVKKLFGLESSITDTSMKGGRGSILGSIAAMKMAKNVLNNVPKVAKGVTGRVKAGRDVRQAKIDAHDKLMRLNTRYGINDGFNNTLSESKPTNTANAVSSANAASAASAASAAKAASAASAASAAKAASAANAAKSNSSSGNNSKNNNSNYDKYLDKKEKIMEDYQKKLSDAKKTKRDSYKNITSGVFETIGAVKAGTVGLGVGAVIAAGTGEDILSHATKGAGIGIGVGDKIGKAIADANYAPRDISKSVSDVLNSYSKENKKKMERFEEELNKFNAGDI